MPSNKEKSIAEEYIDYHNEYSKKYGKDRTFVLMQVGTFYESYCTNSLGPDLTYIGKLCNITKAKRKHKINDSSTEPLYNVGFPVVSLFKWLDILLEDDYVVVLVDQVKSSDSDKNKKKGEVRKVTNIYSKGTYIDNLSKKDGNFIVSIYFSFDNQKDSKPLLSVGLSGVDVSTGCVYIHEVYSSKYDENLALDETDRFISSLDPKEILIYYQDNTKNKKTKDGSKKNIDYIMNYLKLNMETCKFSDNIDPKYSKLIFQNEMLKKVYSGSKSLLTPIEQLGLDKNIYSIVSLVLVLDFVYCQNPGLLNNLAKPIFFINNSRLTLGNNAIRQLDILDNNIASKCKYKSLFHVINQTSTALGERFLRSRILSPLISKKELETVYDLVDEILNDDYYNKIEDFLDNIKDIERLVRKMELLILKPYEVSILVNSYENILLLIDKIKSKKKLKNINKIIPDDLIISKIKKMIDYIKNVFIMPELDKYSNLEMTTSIFNDGIYDDIDEIKEDVNGANVFIGKLRDELEKLLKDNKKTKGESVHIKKNNKEGYYLSLTSLKGQYLKKKLEKIDEITVAGKKIKTSSLILKDAGKCSKVYFPSLDQKSDNIKQYNDELVIKNKKYFLKELDEIHKYYSNMFKIINSFIAYIDFIKSAAKISAMYGYTRPTVIDKPYGCVKIKQMRHPIIERLIDYEYVPHDICLGNEELKGIMLYGLNSSGKCHGVDTKIMMYDRSIKKVQDIKVGDLLMGDDSKPRKVLSLTQGTGQLYGILPTDHTGHHPEDKITVNGEHILCLMSSEGIIEITVNEYLSKSKEWKSKYYLYKVGIHFDEIKVPIDPYVFGQTIQTDKTINYIPDEYKFNSRKNRMKLLAGLFAERNIIDGPTNFIINIGFTICSKIKQISEDVMYVARSLGFSAHIREAIYTVSEDDKYIARCYVVYISGNKKLYEEMYVELCGEVAASFIHVIENTLMDTEPLIMPFEIFKGNIDKFYGFQVDCNARYLLQNFTVTHNSSAMKGLGLTIIMAQSGLFVPAKEFEFSPYHSLYTRITGDDNIFRGLSSFTLEMVEVNAILKRADEYTLVIGDEVCRGTEHISGNAIVATTILKLTEVKSSFIFATHLHEIMSLKAVKQLTNVKAFHLSVKYDEKTESLIFDRKMTEGSGEQIYGVIVARYIIQDKKFIEQANKIKNELLETYDTMISGKKSNYNNNVYVYECSLCGKQDKKSHLTNLETHHINFQKDCVKGIVKDKPHIKKNSEANLAVLCNECHNKIHNNKIQINGYVMSSKGRIIDVVEKD